MWRPQSPPLHWCARGRIPARLAAGKEVPAPCPLARPPVSGTEARPEPLRARSPLGRCADPSPRQRMARGAVRGAAWLRAPSPIRASVGSGLGPSEAGGRDEREGRAVVKGGGPAALSQGSGVIHGSQTMNLLETPLSSSWNLRSNEERRHGRWAQSCPQATCGPPARPLCPRESPGTDTGEGCHTLLQGIFPSQGLNPHLLRLLPCRWVLYHRATGEARTAGDCRC